MIGEPRFVYDGGVIVAKTLRVLFVSRYGARWHEASAEAKAEAMKRWETIRAEWKKDPGIRFVSYYCSRGPDTGHHFLFEVDDVNTLETKMSNPFWEADFPLEEYYFELVTGDTESDAFWTS